MITLGSYTVAESATQRVAAVAERTSVAAVGRARAEVAGERERAVATAQGAVADASAVQTVAAGSVSDAELAPLTHAVAQLTALIGRVPGGPGHANGSASAAPAAQGDAAAGSGAAPASRGVTRGPLSGLPTGTALAGTAPTGTAPTDAATSAASVGDGAAAGQASPSPSGAAAPTPSSDLRAGIGAALRTPADDAAPDDRVAAGIVASAARVADLTAQVRSAAQVNVDAAQAVATTAAETEPAVAQTAERNAQRASLAGYANGRVPADALCTISFAPGQRLRCDAAAGLDRLNASYRTTFGADLAVTDSYRSYPAQVACSRSKGRLCASPGTSNHGRGVAVDLGSGVQVFGSSQHAWMVDHAGEFGWVLPAWAGPSGYKSEPWHWEFTG